MTFWEHLDELRAVLFRSVLVLFGVALVLFFLKDFIFGKIIFAPINEDFVLYRLINRLLASIGQPPIPPFNLELINIDLTAQFYIHMSTSFYLAIVICTPIILYFFWTFVSPALYPNEKKAVVKAFSLAAVFFYLGVLAGYFMLFPMALRFLGTYQVSTDVPNQISLKSYISTFFSLILIMGVVFELPAVTSLLSKLGILHRGILKKYRRHALIVLMILAAAITPSDPFTMLAVGVPLYGLYELSILMCKPKKEEAEEEPNLPEK